jgi:RNA recognition motif-containing protein
MRLRRTRGNVFVANLPEDFSDERLAEAFDPYGIVLSASVARDPESGRRLRYGFVDIATERAAKAAIAALNGVAIDGHAIEVKVSEQKAGPNKLGRPARPPARRLGLRPAGGEDGAGRGFAAAAEPRKAPSFQVERRALPRRLSSVTPRSA